MHFSVLESPPESQTSLVLENTTRTRREGTRVTACRGENQDGPIAGQAVGTPHDLGRNQELESRNARFQGWDVHILLDPVWEMCINSEYTSNKICYIYIYTNRIVCSIKKKNLPFPFQGGYKRVHQSPECD